MPTENDPFRDSGPLGSNSDGARRVAASNLVFVISECKPCGQEGALIVFECARWDVEIPADGRALSATVSCPDGVSKGGLILLHPSNDGSRRQFLFEDLATRLPMLGITVLRYDRRPKIEDADVPHEHQVADVEHALRWYREHLGPEPVGLWGFSQGAWVAILAAAADPSIAFVVVVGGSAVSPAIQMRYGAAEQLRRAGYGSAALGELAALRLAWEGWQRGVVSREAAQNTINQFAGRPWFTLSWVPPVVPEHPSWADMDFDPAETISALRCPVLAFYGHDEWIPVADSVKVWESRITDPGQLTIHYLDGAGHHPTLHDGRAIDAISPAYTETMDRWILDRVA